MSFGNLARILACGLVLTAAAAQAEAEGGAAPAIEERAVQLVKKMAKTVSAMKTSRISTEYALEVVLESGQKLQYVGEATSWLQRPNALRTERVGARSSTVFVYDGKQISLYADPPGFYATREAPATIDEMLEFALDRLGVGPPGVDLLYSDGGLGLLDGVTAGSYLGVATVAGRRCHHVAFRAPEVDWQLWVEDGENAFPCRYVITALDVKGAPETVVTVREWAGDPEIPAGHFRFTPPEGARRIAFETDAALFERLRGA